VTKIPRGEYLGRLVGGPPTTGRSIAEISAISWSTRVRYRNRHRTNRNDGRSVEIRIDGTPRTYRDRKDFAMDAARLIKSKNPPSMVEVKT
jgi:hypothetical protein